MLANLLANLGPHTNVKLEENMVRAMILNNIRFYKQKFGAEYGEMVIACDNNNYWRKQVFPHYKANRKKLQEESELDWHEIFEFLDKVRDELKQYFPYKVLDVESCEADDIIGTLIIQLNTSEKFLILSGDKDFIQLQTFETVRQYDPVKKKWIAHADPHTYLLEHIMKGDRNDGIPNILSSDDCIVKEVRQKHLTKKRIDQFIASPWIMDGMKVKRNETLINLKYIPKHLQEKILKQYYEQGPKNRSLLMTYFMKYKLKNLLENLSEY